jgi:hypothetical protein
MELRVVRDRGRSAVLLGPGQGGLRVAREQARVGRGGRCRRGADRHGEPTGSRPEVAADGRRQDPPGDRHRRVEIRVREEDGELVAADPEGPVGPAQDRRGDPPNRHEKVVAGGVPALVVDLLEPIEIEREHRQRTRVAMDGLELAGQLVLEGAVAAEPGQGVDLRVELGSVVELDELGPLGVHRGRVAQDHAGLRGHEGGQGERRGDEDQGRGHARGRSAGPEALDGGHAHERDEWDEHAEREADPDRSQPTAVTPHRIASRWCGHDPLDGSPVRHLYASGVDLYAAEGTDGR